jgi:hypothetical protein
VPVTVLWAAKGGSGTTVVTAALAIATPTDTLVVDLAGDLPDALGVTAPGQQGIGDWLHSDAPASALWDLAVGLDPTTSLIPRGQPVDPGAARWSELVDALAQHPAVYVDAGTGPPPPALCTGAVRSLLVTRACYLALRRAIASRCRPEGVIIVSEPGRSLGRAEVERALGAPVVATVDVDVAVARAVDAGLLHARPPRLLVRQLRRALRADHRGGAGFPARARLALTARSAGAPDAAGAPDDVEVLRS